MKIIIGLPWLRFETEESLQAFELLCPPRQKTPAVIESEWQSV